MGYDYRENATKAEIIREITTQWANQQAVFTCLAHVVRGNVLWTVWERKEDSGKVDVFIGCDILRSMKGFGWGHKAMQESVHPYYYSCPLSYLDMAPETCPEWRAKVREYHAKRNRKFNLGDVVNLVGSKVEAVEIVSLKPLHGRCIKTGITYRIPRSMLGDLRLPVASRQDKYKFE